MLEIVTHCWSGDAVPIYHLMLQLQLSSLILNPPAVETRYTLFFTEDDRRTKQVIEAFIDKANLYVDVNLQQLDKSCLFRRSIGRHQAALATTADVVWFTDVDYLFYDNSIRQANDACMISEAELVYPDIVHHHRNHFLGDKLLENAESKPGEVMSINPDEFRPKSYLIAIGGIQIVKGDFCREHGYAKRRLRRRPVNPDLGFQKCRGDADFRKMLTKPRERIELNTVYRIRHSRCGRDGGKYDHSLGKRMIK